MVVAGRSLGAGGLACDLAALLTERDILRRQDGVPEADLGLRLDLLRGAVERTDVDRDALRRVRAEARICREAGGSSAPRGGESPVSPGVRLALAYPHPPPPRRRADGGRFLLRNGRGAFLDPQALAQADHLVAAELDGRPRESRIFLAAPLAREEIETHFANDIVREDVLGWDDATRAVIARRRRRLGAIVLQEAPLGDPDPGAVTQALLGGIRRQGIEQLPWSEPARRLRERLAFLHRLGPGWPDVSDGALTAGLDEWLGPWIEGLRRLDELGRIDLGELLMHLLPWDRRAALDELAPAHVQVPSGSRIPVDYSDPAAPALAVRLQELFGLTETPTVGGGRVPLTLHLLSPARRPVQVTRDLAGFWRTTYFEVRKDLKGRYPKHHWPDDPLTAEPTRQAKRRGPSGT
jgi:ATP-dependent helicase HrpB